MLLPEVTERGVCRQIPAHAVPEGPGSGSSPGPGGFHGILGSSPLVLGRLRHSWKSVPRLQRRWFPILKSRSLSPSRFSAAPGGGPRPRSHWVAVEKEARTKGGVGGPRMPVDQAADGASTLWNNAEESGSARLVARSWAQNTVLAGPGSAGVGWPRWFRLERRLEGGGRLEAGASWVSSGQTLLTQRQIGAAGAPPDYLLVSVS